MIDSQDPCPDIDQHWLEISSWTLQKLEHIRENPNTQGQVDSPGPQVQELAQKNQGSQAMHLRQKNLENDG